MSMDPPWPIHGQFNDSPWTHHGLAMDHHGPSMDTQKHNGLTLAPPWTVHGLSMDHHGAPVDCPWNAWTHGPTTNPDQHAPSMDCPWEHHGLPMDPPWGHQGPLRTHRTPPWTVHGRSIDHRGSSIDPPCRHHGQSIDRLGTHHGPTIYNQPRTVHGLSMDARWT